MNYAMYDVSEFTMTMCVTIQLLTLHVLYWLSLQSVSMLSEWGEGTLISSIQLMKTGVMWVSRITWSDGERDREKDKWNSYINWEE